MAKNEDKALRNHLRKERIRERYSGENADKLELIEAKKHESFYEDNSPKRVAVYARVSTGNVQQTSSYELQKNHYQHEVDRHPNWNLVEIYADEGISGTSLKHRDAFIRMMKDCDEGKIDLIITKSVSRFSRNIVDCISEVRRLKNLSKPIGIFFESENIYSLDADSEMSLSFVSTLAQEESHTKSRIMNTSIEMRFRAGILLTPELFGYKQNEDGELVIYEEEARIVRLIFFMYLYGYSITQIAKTLSKLLPSPNGKDEWSSSTIGQILRNERHCGDVLAHKTWTPDYLTHKSKKNVNNVNQYYWRDHHDPIISRDDFIAVQRKLENAKYGTQRFLPKLRVISEGSLKGFVSVNPRWMPFTKEDYIKASKSVLNKKDLEVLCSNKITVNTGEFDLRGFEVARSQFFESKDTPNITFGKSDLRFSTSCLHKLNDNMYIEILIHPFAKLLAIRPCKENNPNAIQWLKKHGVKVTPKPMNSLVLSTLMFDMWDWDKTNRYRISGTKKSNEDEQAIIFDISDTITFIPSNMIFTKSSENSITSSGIKKVYKAYPADWVDNFGDDYYVQSQDVSKTDDKMWNKESTFNTHPELHITTQKEITDGIASILDEITQEVANG